MKCLNRFRIISLNRELRKKMVRKTKLNWVDEVSYRILVITLNVILEKLKAVYHQNITGTKTILQHRNSVDKLSMVV